MNKSELTAKFSRLSGYLQQDLENSTLFRDCFELAIQLGEFDKAQKLIETRPSSFAKDSLTRYCQSKLALANNDFSTALKLSEQLLEDGVDELGIRYNICWAEFNLQNYQQVLEITGQLGELKQNYPPFLLLESRALHHLGRLPEALFLTRHFIEQYPESDEALGLLSLLLLDSSNYIEAEQFANAAQRINQTNHESLITLSTISLNNQDVDDANRLLSINSNITHKSGRLMLNLGQAQMLNMEFDLAENSLAEATQLMGQHIGTWHALAWVKIVLGKIEEARVCFEKAFELDRNFSESHGGLAVVAIHEGRVVEAEKLTKTALRLDPQCRSGRYAETLLLQNRGAIQEAEGKLNALIEGSKTSDGRPILDVVAQVAARLKTKHDESKD